MPFLELNLQADEADTELISDFLEKADAFSVTWKAAKEQLALFEPDLGTTPLWSRVEISALFYEDKVLATLTDALRREFGEKRILFPRGNIIADKCWERVCLDNFKAMRFGEHLWICPSHIDSKNLNGIIVCLDPGLAFGTGTHPSTALCLDWLAYHIEDGQTVIDYGCGSGILAIAALKCGAEKVFAIDHDIQAIEATRVNAKKNNILAKQISCLLTKEFTQDVKVDVLIANILAQPLMDLSIVFKKLLKKRGLCILAGILSEQVKDVQQFYCEQGFKCIDRQDQQGWARIVLSLSP